MLLTSLLVMSLTAEPTAWVTVSRRSGVTRAQALDLARSISTRLSAEGIKLLPADDLASCGGKVPCLMEKGRTAHAEAMICLDVGGVLDDEVVLIALYSVEEDGRRVGQLQFEGQRKDWSPARIEPLIPDLKKLLGLDAVAPVPPPPPEPATPAPAVTAAPAAEPPALIAPPPSHVVATQQSSSPAHTAGVAGLIAGAAGLVASGIMGIVSMTSASQRYQLCPAGMVCTSQTAFAAYGRAATAQTAGWVTFGISAALAALGAVLFFVF